MVNRASQPQNEARQVTSPWPRWSSFNHPMAEGTGLEEVEKQRGKRSFDGCSERSVQGKRKPEEVCSSARCLLFCVILWWRETSNVSDSRWEASGGQMCRGQVKRTAGQHVTSHTSLLSPRRKGSSKSGQKVENELSWEIQQALEPRWWCSAYRTQAVLSTSTYHVQHHTRNYTKISVRVLRSRNWQDDYGVKFK